MTGVSPTTTATLDKKTWGLPLREEGVADRTTTGFSSSSVSFFSSFEPLSSQSSAGYTVGRKDVSYASPAFKGIERDGERDGEGGRGKRRARAGEGVG